MESVLKENASRLSSLQSDVDEFRSERQRLERENLAKEHQCSTLQTKRKQSLKQTEAVQAQLSVIHVKFSKKVEPSGAAKNEKLEEEIRSLRR